MAADCSQRLGLLQDETIIPRQDALLRAFDLPLTHNVPALEASRLADHCLLDKKARGGRTRFVLPRALGDIAIVDNPDNQQVIAAFASAMG